MAQKLDAAMKKNADWPIRLMKAMDGKPVGWEKKGPLVSRLPDITEVSPRPAWDTWNSEDMLHIMEQVDVDCNLLCHQDTCRAIPGEATYAVMNDKLNMLKARLTQPVRLLDNFSGCGGRYDEEEKGYYFMGPAADAMDCAYRAEYEETSPLPATAPSTPQKTDGHTIFTLESRPNHWIGYVRSMPYASARTLPSEETVMDDTDASSTVNK